MNTRTKLIKLAYENPELRKDLLPLLKSAGMPSANRRSIIGPAGGKVRRAWMDWFKTDIQTKFEQKGVPQKVIEEAINAVCGWDYGILWDKGIWGPSKGKFEVFSTSQEIKDWVQGKLKLTETNFGDPWRKKWLVSYPQFIKDYINEYGQANTEAVKDKAMALFNKSKEYQIQLAMAWGGTGFPSGQGQYGKYKDINEIKDGIQTGSAEYITKMIPYLEWALKIPKPPGK